MKYLDHTPFTANDVEVDIWVYAPHLSRIVDPDIKWVSLYKGKIWYRAEDPQDQFKYKSEVSEPYGEASQKVKGL